jgi:hypothetical protein
MTIEVPRHEWVDTLMAFSSEHRAWLAHVEREDRQVSPGPDRPLTGVFAEHRGSRIVAIRIDFAGDTAGAVSERIENPAVVEIETTPDGGTSGMRIEDLGGHCTRVRFRVVPTDMLDGVAPAET